jgi:hypothetical protein
MDSRLNNYQADLTILGDAHHTSSSKGPLGSLGA